MVNSAIGSVCSPRSVCGAHGPLDGINDTPLRMGVVIKGPDLVSRLRCNDERSGVRCRSGCHITDFDHILIFSRLSLESEEHGLNARAPRTWHESYRGVLMRLHTNGGRFTSVVRIGRND